MNNPIKNLTRSEWILWLGSLIIITISNIISGDFNLLTLITTWIGITALIFAAKGNVWAQILIIVFSILYGIISWQFRYWGEMITYLGMTLPMAIWSTITWIKNPAKIFHFIMKLMINDPEYHLNLLIYLFLLLS